MIRSLKDGHFVSHQHAAIGDFDTLLGSAVGSAIRLNQLDNVETFRDFAKHDMFSIEPRARHASDEELRSICVGARIGHGKKSRFRVLQEKVLICELRAINGLSSSAISTSEITALEHESGDDPVERGILEVQRLSALADALLTST